MNEHSHYEIPAPSEPAQPDAPNDFSSVAARFNENLAAAALRLVDASQDFVAMIQGFTAAGEVLERSLSLHRELGVATQRALEEARKAASDAGASATEAAQARAHAMNLVEESERRYGSVSDLVDNLQHRIAALSILAQPMPRAVPYEPALEPPHDETWESDDMPDITELRAAS